MNPVFTQSDPGTYQRTTQGLTQSPNRHDEGLVSSHPRPRSSDQTESLTSTQTLITRIIIPVLVRTQGVQRKHPFWLWSDTLSPGPRCKYPFTPTKIRRRPWCNHWDWEPTPKSRVSPRVRTRSGHKRLEDGPRLSKVFRQNRYLPTV